MSSSYIEFVNKTASDETDYLSDCATVTDMESTLYALESQSKANDVWSEWTQILVIILSFMVFILALELYLERFVYHLHRHPKAILTPEKKLRKSSNTFLKPSCGRLLRRTWRSWKWYTITNKACYTHTLILSYSNLLYSTHQSNPYFYRAAF